MARRTRAKQTDRDDDELSYDEYSSAGARPPGPGGRRNVAPGAQELEGDDHDEDNRRNVGGEGGGGIQTGTYEDDYGPGARGLRQPEFETEPTDDASNAVLRRPTRSGKVKEDFPSGTWLKQRTRAKLKKVKSGKMRARKATGRGVGVRRTSRTASSARRAKRE